MSTIGRIADIPEGDPKAVQPLPDLVPTPSHMAAGPPRDAHGERPATEESDHENDSAETAFQLIEDRLASLRLGVAGSLFQTLRLKHPPTARHALRVAMVCSAWAKLNELDDADRESLEIAALLHDLGKIGISDQLLQLQAAPTNEQWQAIEQHWALGVQIVISLCGVGSPVHQLIAAAGSWFDGSHTLLDRVGLDTPLGGRMIAVVDTYDTLVSRDLWPSKIDPQAAIARLRAQSGQRLDPQMTETFIELHGSNQLGIREVMHRWLTQLLPSSANQHWQAREQTVQCESPTAVEALFFRQMLEHIHEGVIFVTVEGKIEQWNGGVERLTGIAPEDVISQPWDPTLIGLRHENGQFVRRDDCPVLRAIQSGAVSRRRMHLRSLDGAPGAADVRIFPVRNSWGTILGVAVNLADASLEKDLEQRVQTLHEKATTDPLTGAANRGEFDRFLTETLIKNTETGKSCSLIICDIDHFKAVNDELGHQAGDEALVSFATILHNSRRDGDLVGRYGGEEFVIVCDDCHARDAYALAERIRIVLSQTPLKELSGRCITASFGVSHSRTGDQAEDLLRRADLALLKAKDTGRNRVIAAESCDPSPSETATGTRKSWWPAWRGRSDPLDREHQVERYLATNVPVNVAAEKLRGFVAEHEAIVVDTTDERVILEMDAFAAEPQSTQTRRRSDRPFPVQVELVFGGIDKSTPVAVRPALTVIHVRVTPLHGAAPQIDPIEVGRRVIYNLRSYLMAHDYEAENHGNDVATSPGETAV